MSSERIKHLEFIQNTITRQASHSFAVKGWSLTVAAVIYAYAAAHLSWWMALVALLPAVAFAGLDAFYLRQERLFRALYRDVSQQGTAVPMFEMDTRCYTDKNAFPPCRYWGKKGVFRSTSWWLLHGMIVTVGVVLLGVAVFQAAGAAKLAQCIRDVF